MVSELESTVDEVEALKHNVQGYVRSDVEQANKEINNLLQQLKELSHTVEVSLKGKLINYDFLILYFLLGGQSNQTGVFRHGRSQSVN